MSSCGFWPSALAISTICRRDSGRSRTRESGLTSSQPTSASSASARRRWARASIRPKRLGGAAMEMLSATERSGISDSSWKMQTTPAARRGGRTAEMTRAAVERDRARVRLDHAGDDLDQRRLAGAVLAQHRVDLAAPAGEIDVLQRAHAAVALGDLRQDEESRLAARPPWLASTRSGDERRRGGEALGPASRRASVRVADQRSLGVLLALRHDFRRGEVDAARRELRWARRSRP